MSNTPMGNSAVSKVTPQAAIIINSAVDAVDTSMRMRNSGNTPYTDLHEDNFAVMRGELVFTSRRSDGKAPISAYAGKNNPTVAVTSNLNGKPYTGSLSGKTITTPEAKKEALDHMENDIWFVGVAQGEKSQRDFDNRSLALAVRVAGSDTIFNNGDEIIRPGDDVVWSLPDPNGSYSCRYGQPKTKRCLVVGKYNYSSKRISEDVRRCMASSGTNTDEGVVKTSLNQFADVFENKSKDEIIRMMSGGNGHEAFVNMLQHTIQYKRMRYDSKVIGKALSQGDPGHSFDILLNHSHSTA